jgi:hypothetical protein
MGWDEMERRGGKVEETEVDGWLVGFRDTLDLVLFSDLLFRSMSRKSHGDNEITTDGHQRPFTE